MSYTLWIILNAIFILVSLIFFEVFNSNVRTTILIGQFFGQISVFLFLINVSLYFIFLTIKKVKKREIKTFMARLSKRVYRPHIHIAITGASLVLLHAGLMLYRLSGRIGFMNSKMLTGYFAVLMLITTLIGGYRRRQRATGPRRKFHARAALIFALAFFLHILMPVFWG